MKEQIYRFKDFLLKENKIIPEIYNNNFCSIRWIDETKKTKEVGIFDLDIIDNEAVIVGYKKYDKSIIVLNHILDINQNEISAYYNLGVNYACMDNPEEARKYFIHVKRIITEERIKRTPDSVGEYTALASITARLGDMDSSMKMLQKAIEFDSTSHESFAEVFCLYGKVPEAINELEKAFKNGYRNLYWLKASPDLQVLQYDIRLRTLIEKYFKEDF